MKRCAFCLVAALLAAGFSAQSLAAPPPFAKLTAGQKAKRAALEARRARLKELTGQLRAELKKKPVDQAKIKKLKNQLALERDTARLELLQSLASRPNRQPASRQRLNNAIQKLKERIAKERSGQ
ncbi:MAG: hypothetical protein JW873_07490 [Candidatus Saganbacteria bacterium]|nr:hypothetical protein [Candidatus Saganbacteria bacterium]